jgi:hypothetical protein
MIEKDFELEDHPKCRWCGKPVDGVEEWKAQPAPSKSGVSYIHVKCEELSKQKKRHLKRAIAAVNE